MGSIVGAGLNYGLGQDQMHFQREENKKARDWQTSERQQAEIFAQEQLLREQNYQTDEWNRQFTAQNQEYDRRLADEREYNSPAAQAARLRAAGVNSAVIAGGSTAGSNGTFAPPPSTSVSSPSASAPVAPGAANSPMPSAPNMSLMGNVLGEIGSFVRDISQSDLNNAQANRITSLLQGEVEGFMLQNKGKELLNSWQSTLNDIQKATKDTTIAKAFQELVQIKTDIFLKGTQSEYYGANADYLVQEKLFTMAKKRLTDKEYDKLVFEVKNQEMLFNSTLKMMNAQTEDYRAGARLKNISADLSDIEKNIQSKSAKDRLSAIVADARAQAAAAGNKELEAKVNQIENTIQLEIKSKHPKYSRLSTAIHELKTYIPALINSGR